MAKWLGAAILVVGGLFALGTISSMEDDPAAEAVASKAVTIVGYGVGWDHIKIDTAKSNEYALDLIYRPPGPDSIFTVITDTQKIARAVLSELVASGHHPADEHTFLWVWAEVPAGTGETGAKLVRIYGHTEYNSNSDQLEFKPWKQ
jgi:hypothetical protein